MYGQGIVELVCDHEHRFDLGWVNLLDPLAIGVEEIISGARLLFLLLVFVVFLCLFLLPDFL